MNDEIKEILDLLKDTTDLSLFAVCGTKEELENMPKYVNKRLAITNEQAKTLLDYITNLQQENERLKEILKWKQNRETELFTIESVLETNKQLYDERNIYRLRCDKASDKLGKYKHYSTPTEEQNSENEDIVDSALNILQNGSDSQ